MLLGFVIFWIAILVYAIIEGFAKRGLSWQPTANTLVFPLGTVCTAFLELSIVMDSPAFRVLTAGLLVILVVVLLLNFVMTAIGIAKGELLIVRDNPRVKSQQE